MKMFLLKFRFRFLDFDFLTFQNHCTVAYFRICTCKLIYCIDITHISCILFTYPFIPYYSVLISLLKCVLVLYIILQYFTKLTGFFSTKDANLVNLFSQKMIYEILFLVRFSLLSTICTPSKLGIMGAVVFINKDLDS